MKKFFKQCCEYWRPILVAAALLVSLAVATTFTDNKQGMLQPNTFFFEDRPRFIYVDKGEVVDHKNGAVIADRVTGVLYLYIDQDNIMCPMYNSDGTLMLLDEG